MSAEGAPARPFWPALLWSVPWAAAARVWAGLRQPAGVGPLSPAELKLLDPRTVPHDGMPTIDALTTMLADHANMHHGGYLFVQLLCWGVDGAARAAGIDLPLLSLRLTGLLLGLAGVAAWAWAAAGLRLHPVAVGICLALPPLWATQGWSLAYGSHAEVGALVGLLVGALARGRAGLAAGAAGAAAGFDLAVAPALLVTAPLWARGRWRSLGAAALGASPYVLPRLFAAGSRLWSLGVAEGPHTRPIDLVWSALDPFQLGAALRSLRGLSLVPPAAWGGWGGGVSAVLLAAFALCGLWGAAAAARPAGVRLLLALPWAHLASLALFSPMRPGIAYRYLLPVLGAVLLWPALAARRGGVAGALAWAVVVGSGGMQAQQLVALPVTGTAAERVAWAGGGGAPTWPWAAQRAGLTQLDPSGAPVFAALASCRADPQRDRALWSLDADPLWLGAVAVVEQRAGTARLGEPGRPPQPVLDLPDRLQRAGPNAAVGAGIGLAALEPAAPDAVRRTVARVHSAAQPAVLAGLLWGRHARLAPPDCAALATAVHGRSAQPQR